MKYNSFKEKYMAVIFCVITITTVLLYAGYVQTYELDRDTRKDLKDKV